MGEVPPSLILDNRPRRRHLDCVADKLRSPKDVEDRKLGSFWPPWITRKDLERLERKLDQYMIAQATFDTSLANLTAAVNAAALAIAAGSTATSTPDSVVSAFVAGVDAQTLVLATATPPAPPAAAKKP